MRSLFLSLVGGCLLGCRLITFDIEQELGEQRFAGTLEEVSLLSEPLSQIHLSSEVVEGLIERIDGVYLKGFELRITPNGEEDGGDSFDFVDELEVYARTEGAPELPRVLIARTSDKEEGARSLVIPAAGEVNLREYLEAGLIIETELTGTSPGTDVTFDGVLTILVQPF